MTLELNQVQTHALPEPVSLRVSTGGVANVEADGQAGDDLLLAIVGLRPLQGGVVSLDGAPLTPLSAPWFRRMTAFAPSRLSVTPDSAIERALSGRGYQAGTMTQWCVESLGLAPSLMGSVESEAALIGMDMQVAHSLPAALTDDQRRQLLLAVAVARATRLLLVCQPLCPEGYLQQMAQRRQLAVVSVGEGVAQ